MRKHNTEPQFNILIDTCVWLDVAKDYQQQAILAALEGLVRQENIALILPCTVVDESARNKARVIEESSRSLSSTLKRVKEAVGKFGGPRKKGAVLSQLNDVDHRLPTLGEAAVDTVGRIEKLFTYTPVIEISDAVKLRAAQRHRQACSLSPTAKRHRRCDPSGSVRRCDFNESNTGRPLCRKYGGLWFALSSVHSFDLSTKDARRLPADLLVPQ